MGGQMKLKPVVRCAMVGVLAALAAGIILSSTFRSLIPPAARPATVPTGRPDEANGVAAAAPPASKPFPTLTFAMVKSAFLRSEPIGIHVTVANDTARDIEFVAYS